MAWYGRAERGGRAQGRARPQDLNTPTMPLRISVCHKPGINTVTLFCGPQAARSAAAADGGSPGAADDELDMLDAGEAFERMQVGAGE